MWDFVLKTMEDQAKLFGFTRVRTPVFECEELYVGSSGAGSDVVSKEMYTFLDKSGRRLALRPEGTAGVARAVIQDGALSRYPLPLKVFYIMPCYRYEKPQNCRYREFTQFGVEVFGSDSCMADTETMMLAFSIFRELCLAEKTVLKINSVGCSRCREGYISAIKGYFSKKFSYLCDDCTTRLRSNPMRILDCKVDTCKGIVKGAPSILDFICEDCADHFYGVKDCLNAVGIDYVVDPSVVRGLDYYTGVVFELDYRSSSGTFVTICGGGRYDTLLEKLGGGMTPALGFGIGVDRLLVSLEDSEIDIKKAPGPDIFFAYTDRQCAAFCLSLVKELRLRKICAQLDVKGDRSVSAQIKYAAKKGARFFSVVGGNELSDGKLILKNMKTSQSFTLDIGDDFCDNVLNLLKRSDSIASL